MVVGTAGASFTENYVTPPPVWNEMVTYEWGYAVVEAVNASYLSWKWIRSSDDAVLDRMVITQVDHNQPWVLPNTSSESNNSSSNSTIVLIIIFVLMGASVGLYALVFLYALKRNRDNPDDSLNATLVAKPRNFSEF
jgi:hypothetical protein